MMRTGIALLLAGCILSSCDQREATTSPGPKSPGRYAGVGIFETGRLWREMAGVTAPQDPKAAKLEDDEHVIVVIDSHTGEVRQCGDHSGFCVAMNPWTRVGTELPAKLTNHAADLAAEDQKAAEGNSSANGAAPVRQRPAPVDK